jgi:hypothetical protein
MDRLDNKRNGSGSQSGSLGVSYQWVANAFLTVFGTLMLGGIGWLQTTQTEFSSKIDVVSREIQSVHDSVIAIQGELSTVRQDHDDITRLNAIILSQQYKITAHAEKSEANDPPAIASNKDKIVAPAKSKTRTK